MSQELKSCCGDFQPNKIKLSQENYNRICLYIRRTMNMAKDMSIMTKCNSVLAMWQTEDPNNIIENGRRILDDLEF